MHMFKLLFQELQVWPTLAPGRNRGPPGEQLKTTTWGTAGDIRAFAFQVETDYHQGRLTG